MKSAFMLSSAIPQSRGNAIDGEMDGLDDALVGVAGAIALQQLELYVVERVDIGETIANGACEGGVAFEKRVLLEDRQQRLPRAFVFVADAGEYRFAQLRIGDQLLVARRDP